MIFSKEKKGRDPLDGIGSKDFSHFFFQSKIESKENQIDGLPRATFLKSFFLRLFSS